MKYCCNKVIPKITKNITKNIINTTKTNAIPIISAIGPLNVEFPIFNTIFYFLFKISFPPNKTIEKIGVGTAKSTEAIIASLNESLTPLLVNNNCKNKTEKNPIPIAIGIEIGEDKPKVETAIEDSKTSKTNKTIIVM